MWPVLFKIGPMPVNSYGLLLVCGFFCGYLLCRREFKYHGFPADFAATFVSLAMISAIVGSRLFHVLEHLDEYSGRRWVNIFAGSGFSWYGGVVLVIITTIWYARKRGIHWATFIDAASPACAIGYGFGRIGCFLSGDGCYGQPCARLGLSWPAPLCMAFPTGAIPTSEIVFNTPLIELAGAILLFGHLQYMQRRIKAPVVLFAQMLIIHSVMRFAVEFIRLNPPLALGLSQAQWLSIAGVGIGAYLIKLSPSIQIPVEKKKFSKKR
ncbi:MAG: prolipoprotein diacylglyceryl transferase [Smithellaceae bacterium]|nr:prolipoprotein diacylglyceryl transferase [Smithellaceae bacterium]